MTRQPDWTESEFTVLLIRHDASDQELCDLLPGRTAGAIISVRSGIHEFHMNGPSNLLSQMMVRKLEEPGVSWTCPVCSHSSPS
jgi:hypothetical protein